MARALYSGIGISGMSGSINKNAGGTTFSKNGIVRNRVVPVNPQTADQQTLRAAFLFLTSAFSGLTESQVNSWEVARVSNVYYQKQDPLTGVTRPFASAKDLFIAMNLNYLVADDALASPAVTFSVPDASAGQDAITAVTVASDASSGTVTLSFTGTLTNERMVFSATPPQSVGTQREASVASKYRVITAGALTSPTAAGTAYTNKFGTIAAATGKKIFWRVEGVDALTGKKRLIQSGVTTIVA